MAGAYKGGCTGGLLAVAQSCYNAATELQKSTCNCWPGHASLAVLVGSCWLPAALHDGLLEGGEGSP